MKRPLFTSFLIMTFATVGGCGNSTTPTHTTTSVTPPTHCHSVNGLPDRSCTPGLASQPRPRCNGTRSVRPPMSYTNALKVKQLRQYDFADKNTKDYEEDHLLPLALGGDPRSPSNLWPEPRSGSGDTATKKDRAEFRAYREACNGSLSAAKAQQLFLTNGWLSYEK